MTRSYDHPLAMAARRVLGVAAVAGFALAGADAARAESPVVVELFTSQGCSSCPPADELVGKLKDEPGIIPLSLHVDYWDYIGWEDPYADARYTARQKRYVGDMDRQYVYTPQMVVQGRYDAVGSRAGEVRRAIEQARETPVEVRPRFDTADGRVVVPAADAAGEATVWLAFYDDKHVTEVASGENAGRTLTNYNVVRRFERLGTWDGSRRAYPVEVDRAAENGRDHCAVIVQKGRTGPVLGAAAMPLDAPSG